MVLSLIYLLSGEEALKLKKSADSLKKIIETIEL